VTVGQRRARDMPAGRNNGSGRVHDGARAVHESGDQPAPLAGATRGAGRIGRGSEVHDRCEVDRLEQQHRVQVGVAGSKTEVQDDSTVTRPASTARADDVARSNARASSHGDRGEERVGRTQIPRARHDVSAPATDTGDETTPVRPRARGPGAAARSRRRARRKP
jgi:hypothetical protein